MANPQKENGHTQIANEILEALIAFNLNGTEFAVVLHIIRKTYGFNKKEDEISLSQFLKAIPATKPTICSALKKLQLVKIIKLVSVGNSKSCSNRYTINKNYDEWELVKKPKLVKNTKRTSKDFNTQLVKKPLHTKDTLTKDNIQNTYKRVYDFWNEKKIITHTKCTSKMMTRIASALKDYSLEDVLGAISKYSTVLSGRDYFWSYKWTLEEFLQRGLTKFIDTPIAEFLKNDIKKDPKIGLRKQSQQDQEIRDRYSEEAKNNPVKRETILSIKRAIQ